MNVPKLSASLLLVLPVACSDEDSPGDPTMGSGQLTPSELIARGDYLVNDVESCSDCHTPRGPMGVLIAEQYLAGVDCWVRSDTGGCLPTRNLTNHETGLANRTDAEIERMIRDGIRPAATGDEPLFPQMPYYVLHNLKDQDLDAIVAYLRTVPGVEHAVPPRAPEFDLLAPANPLDVSAVPKPMEGYVDPQAAQRGRYLAAEAGPCIVCHTPRDLFSPNVLDYTVFFTGNERFDVGLPEMSIARNITSDTTTGIGDYSVEDIVNVLKQGQDPQGIGLCPPMAGLFARMTDADVWDVASYIKALPPLPGLAADNCVFPPPM